MAYNPYSMYQPQQPNYDYNTMRNQLAQLQQMQQQMSVQPPSNMGNSQQFYSNQPNVLQSGMFVVVESIEDMEKYPAPMNGEPVLIFIKGKSIYYSKKMANGATSCQPYSSNVINNAPIEKPKEVVSQDNDNENAIIKMLNGLSERLEKLENREVNNNGLYGSNKTNSTKIENNKKS